jgi:hypothetical protein
MQCYGHICVNLVAVEQDDCNISILKRSCLDILQRQISNEFLNFAKKKFEFRRKSVEIVKALTHF